MSIYGSSVLILINVGGYAGLMFLVTFGKMPSAVPPVFSKIISSTSGRISREFQKMISHELINFN
jgi:hypothetical protein